jgi:hypothetical protein
MPKLTQDALDGLKHTTLTPQANMTQVAATTPATSGVTPKTTQTALVALAMLSAFIYVLYLFAGVGPMEGRIAVILLFLIALVQVVNNSAGVGAFFAAHPTHN